MVTAEIEPERLEKQYHRKWHAGHGRFYAALRSDEVERTKIGRIFGVPAHFYRSAFQHAWGWPLASIRNPDLAFAHEMQLRHFGGFLRQRWRDFFAGQTSSGPITAKPKPRD